MHLELLKHLDSVYGECRQDDVDLIKEDWSIRSLSWHVTEALAYQSKKRMVVTNLPEILNPALNFRDRDDCIWVLWIRTE